MRKSPENITSKPKALKHWLAIVWVSLVLGIPGTIHAQDLDRGHRILLQKGLQVQAMAGNVPGGLSAERWAESNFTTPILCGSLDPNSAPASGGPWARWANTADMNWSQEEISRLVNLQYLDEQSLNSTNITEAASAFALWEDRFPNTLRYTSQWGAQESVATLRTYMEIAQPDILMFDTYPFKGDNPVGGSPTSWYRDLQKYRQLGLGGLDGTGTRPIPYGQWTQAIVYDRLVSESELRLNQFGAWAFGYKLCAAWIYDKSVVFGSQESLLFNGDGDASPTPTFYQMAETNRQSRNLGPALVRLISTDVRMKMGQHRALLWDVDNDLPNGVSSWNVSADPYITNITATNPGSKNNGLPGDVIVGYFNPLSEGFDGPDYENELYFMIVNGLTDASGLAMETAQFIRIDFDFGNSGITSLQRLSRETGEVEEVPLIHDEGPLYHFTLFLEGGTGDLFKFNTGAVFVPEPLEGDANRDGIVSGGDYASVLSHFGEMGKTGDPGLLGDANCDGVVSVGDFASVQANFGSVGGASDGTVPEPATISLLSLGLVALGRRRK